MAKKNKRGRKPKTENDQLIPSSEVKVEAASAPAATPEEIQISFNTIKHLIDDIDKCWTNDRGTTILHRDVFRAQALCVGLLAHNQSLEVDAGNHYHPQTLALNELARAKRERTDATLKPDEAGALRKMFSKFPRNIIVDFRYAGRGQKRPYLRLMTIAEKEARLKPTDVVFTTVGYIRLMAKSTGWITHPAFGEALTKMESFRPNLDEFILRFCPNTKDLKEGHPQLNLSYSDGMTDKLFSKAGEPVQKPTVSSGYCSLELSRSQNEGRQRSSDDLC